MSFATLERAVLAGARETLNNPRLRIKDMLAWSTGEVEARVGEIVVRVPDPGVNVCVAAAMDKRTKDAS